MEPKKIPNKEKLSKVLAENKQNQEVLDIVDIELGKIYEKEVRKWIIKCAKNYNGECEEKKIK